MNSIGADIVVNIKPLKQEIDERKRPGGLYEQHNKGKEPIILLGTFNSYDITIQEPNVFYTGNVTNIDRGRAVNIEFIDSTSKKITTVTEVGLGGNFSGAVSLAPLGFGIINSNAVVLDNNLRVLQRSDSKMRRIPPTIAIDTVVFNRGTSSEPLASSDWTITVTGTCSNLKGGRAIITAKDKYQDSYQQLTSIFESDNDTWTVTFDEYQAPPLESEIGGGLIEWDSSIEFVASSRQLVTNIDVYSNKTVPTPVPNKIIYIRNEWIRSLDLKTHIFQVEGRCVDFQNKELTVTVTDGVNTLSEKTIIPDNGGQYWTVQIDEVVDGVYTDWNGDVTITMSGIDIDGYYHEVIKTSTPPTTPQVTNARIVEWTVDGNLKVYGKTINCRGKYCELLLADTNTPQIPRTYYAKATGTIDDNGEFHAEITPTFDPSSYGKTSPIWLVVYDKYEAGSVIVRASGYEQFWIVTRPIKFGIEDSVLSFRTPTDSQTSVETKVLGHNGKNMKFDLTGNHATTGVLGTLATVTTHIANDKAIAVFDSVPQPGSYAYATATVLNTDGSVVGSNDGNQQFVPYLPSFALYPSIVWQRFADNTKDYVSIGGYLTNAPENASVLVTVYDSTTSIQGQSSVDIYGNFGVQIPEVDANGKSFEWVGPVTVRFDFNQYNLVTPNQTPKPRIVTVVPKTTITQVEKLSNPDFLRIHGVTSGNSGDEWLIKVTGGGASSLQDGFYPGSGQDKVWWADVRIVPRPASGMPLIIQIQMYNSSGLMYDQTITSFTVPY